MTSNLVAFQCCCCLTSGGLSVAYLDNKLKICCWKKTTVISLCKEMAHFLCETVRISRVNFPFQLSKYPLQLRTASYW